LSAPTIRCFELQDPLLERFHVLEDLGVAVQQPFVLLIGDVGLLGGVLQRQPVALCGPVAGQQDERRGIGRLGGEGEVQQDEGIRVERLAEQVGVAGHPEADQRRLQDEESPATQEPRHPVRDARPERRLIEELDVDRVTARWPWRGPSRHLIPPDSPAVGRRPLACGIS
jgi:hypothetical protein